MPASQKRPIQPLRAWRAIRTLLADPERTDQVFEVIEALAGNTLQRNLDRLLTTPGGQRLFEARSSLLDTLRDRDALRARPAGSLGRAYSAFMDEQDLSPDGLVDASEIDNRVEESEEAAWLGLRLRDSHDLWHTVSGYGRDEIGEISLLGFTVAQTGNPGLAAIAFFGAAKISREVGYRRVFGSLIEGWRRGRRASWLPAQDWAELMGLPLDSVRSALNIAPPRRYVPVVRESESSIEAGPESPTTAAVA